MPVEADRNSAREAPEESAPLTALLDHVAVQLAAEYVRLMEHSAAAECVDTPNLPEP